MSLSIAPAPETAELATALAAADLAELGARLKQLRTAADLTQSEAGGGVVSTGYLSRIESGSRRPTLSVLQAIADRLGTTTHDLLLGFSPRAWSEKAVELDWAQLSLRTGDAPKALATTTRLLEEVPPSVPLHRQVLSTHALALEATGDYEQAALRLEELVRGGLDGTRGLEQLMALCRVYRQAGELSRAIEVGERADRHITELGLEGTPEAIKLTLTVAAAHTEAGALGYAARMCQRALAHAESLRTPGDRAGCYWNASIVETKRGNHTEAVSLAHQALVILEEADSARMTARLRTQLGLMQLRTLEQQGDALATLRRAESELRTTDASPADLASNRLGQARAHFLAGDLDRAAADAASCLVDLGDTSHLSRAEARTLQGQIAFHRDDLEGAQQCYREAILALSAVGADRSAAQLWFELGGLFLSVGCQAEALDAFQRAGASTGLRSVDPTRPQPERQAKALLGQQQ